MRRPIQSLVLIAPFLCFLAGSVFAQPAGPVATGGREAVTLVDVDGLIVRCSVKKIASLADDDFLRFEFQNDRDKPVPFDITIFYGISADAVDLGTGKVVFANYSWIASGNPLPPAVHNAIPRGATICSTQPSVESAVSLKLPSKAGWHITATVNLWLRFDGHRFEAPVTRSLTFEWRRPDAAGIDHLRARVDHLLTDTTDVVQSTLIAPMLRVPEVGAGVPVSKLLHALDTMRHPFSGRRGLVQLLIDDHLADPQVVDYYIQQLKAGDPNAVEDLMHGEKEIYIWDDRFIDPLVAVITDDQKINRSGHDALLLLDNHASRWASNAAIREKLSNALTQWPAAKWYGPAPADTPNFQIWAQSHDPKLIPVIAPYLKDKTVVHDFAGDSGIAVNAHVAPIRACDSAFSAICVLRGTPKDQINFTDWQENRGGRLVYRDPQVELQRRDKLIAAMRQSLDAPPAPAKP